MRHCSTAVCKLCAAKARVGRLVPTLSDYACARMMHNFVSIIFAVEVRSAKTVNIMRRENLALYGSDQLCLLK